MVSFFHLPCVDSGLVIAPRDTWHVTILPFKKKKIFFLVTPCSSIWDLVPQPGNEPRPPVVEAWGLSTGLPGGTLYGHSFFWPARS